MIFQGKRYLNVYFFEEYNMSKKQEVDWVEIYKLSLKQDKNAHEVLESMLKNL